MIATGMPVLYDGALLGWAPDHQVTAILAARSGQPADPDSAVLAPQIHVLPMAGTSSLDWPPFTASPLAAGRLWDYVDRGDIVDIAPLLARSAARAFWVPRGRGDSPRHGAGCVVVTEHLKAGEYWLPAGVYMDHWVLREGFPALPASHLLAMPGTVDLAGELDQ